MAGTRYGASLRKQVKKMEVSQHAKYFCEFCGKVSQMNAGCLHYHLLSYTAMPVLFLRNVDNEVPAVGLPLLSVS